MKPTESADSTIVEISEILPIANDGKPAIFVISHPAPLGVEGRKRLQESFNHINHIWNNFGRDPVLFIALDESMTISTITEGALRTHGLTRIKGGEPLAPEPAAIPAEQPS